jgi:exonuclease SbcC
LNAAIEAADMAEKLSNRLTVAKKKKEAAMADLDSQQQIINEANAFLARETEICTGIELLNELLGREKKLIADKSAYESKQNELTQIMRQIAGDEKAEKRLISEKSNLQMKLQNLESVLAKEPELKAQFDLYCSEKLKLESMESASVSHIQISSQISQLETAKAAMDTRTREEFAVRKTKIEGLQERADLLNRVQCIDVNRANCRFLRDAVEARGNIEPLRTESNQWWQTQKAEIQKMQSQVDDLLKQRDSIHYNTDRYKEQRSLVSRLEADAKRFESLSSVREQLTLIQNRIRDIETELDEIRKRAAELNTKETQIQEILKPLVEAATQYGEIKNSIDKASQWVELDKQLPVMEERRQAAKQNLVFLKNNMDDFDSEIKFLQSDYQKAAQNAAGKDGLAKGVYDYENSIKGMRSTIQEITLQLGALHSLLETQAKTKVRISEHQRVILELADEIGVFETLKKAFSQDGISHSIVKSILPVLTAKANTILSQMSAGKMRMKFVPDKVIKSNAAREIETLDVYVEEDGRSRPYLSRSGGEKVKAGLSAILALSELKNNSNGIQIGMLFIDEPPFLDESGVQAYCDGLEMISNQYSYLKVMTITHDPAMKARFPRSLDVVADENGSHVLAA